MTRGGGESLRYDADNARIDPRSNGSFFSATGASHTSLGRRPRDGRPIKTRAKGPTYPERFPTAARTMMRALWIGPSALFDPCGQAT
jgi:hypothetical protein